MRSGSKRTIRRDLWREPVHNHRQHSADAQAAVAKVLARPKSEVHDDHPPDCKTLASRRPVRRRTVA